MSRKSCDVRGPAAGVLVGTSAESLRELLDRGRSKNAGDEAGRVQSGAQVPSPEPPPTPGLQAEMKAGPDPSSPGKADSAASLHPRVGEPDSSSAPFSATEKAAWTCPDLQAAAELAGWSGKILLCQGPLD